MWAFCLKALVTFCLLAGAMFFVDFAELISILLQSNIYYIILAFCILFALSIPQALRWRMILKYFGLSISWISARYNVLLGLLFNQALPSSVGGDAVRIYAARALGLNIVFQSILFDRLFALFSLSAMCLFILLFWVMPILDSAPFLLILALVCLTLVGTVILGYIASVARYFHLNEKPLVKKIIDVSDNFHRLFFSGMICISVISWSLFIHIFISVAGVLIFTGLGANFSFVEIGAIFAVVNLFAVLPVSIGGWGVREGLSIFLFSMVGINYEQALASSLIFGALMLMVGLVGGAIWAVFGKKGEY